MNEKVPASLEALPGEWADWGGFRFFGLGWKNEKKRSRTGTETKLDDEFRVFLPYD